MEIEKLFLENQDYMKAFADAKEGFEKAKDKLLEKLLEKLWEEFKEHFENKYKNIEENVCDSDYSVPICEIEGKDTISFYLSIYEDKKKYTDSCYEYGFILYKKDTRGERSTKELQKTITKHMEQVLGESSEPEETWPWWNSIAESLTDFTKDEVFALHFDKKERDKFIDEKFQEAEELIGKLKQSEEFKKYKWLV